MVFLLCTLGHSFPAVASQISHLFVETTPEQAKIKILNIKPKFQQGIPIKAGNYLIQASAKGYNTRDIWVEVGPQEDKRIRIRLKKKNSLNTAYRPYFKHHTVRQNDTLWRISRKYHVSSDDLRRFNDLKSKKLKIGQKILIPTRPVFKSPIQQYRKERAIELLKTGHEYLAVGEYGKANDFYDQALQSNPYYLNAHYSKGFAYLKLENKSESLKSFNRAVEIDAYNAESHYNLGLAYYIIGIKHAAMDHFRILGILHSMYADKLLKYIKTIR